MERRLREKQYAERTVETYGAWTSRYVAWCESRGQGVEQADGRVVRDFLDMLAADQRVRVATQHQALNAVVRFHEEVLGRKVEGAEDYLRARRSDRVPVVLGRTEVAGLLGQLEGTERLMGELMYGGGLRLMELLRLRVKDVDLERTQMTVRGGKGDKDRLTVLPEQFERCNRIRSGKVIRIAQGGHHGRPGSFDKQEGMEPADVFYTALGEPLELFLKHGQDLLFSS